MRRTLLLMVISALLLTQCRKPSIEFPTAEPANTVSMTITAGPGSKTDITAAGAITWSEGDKLYVGFDGKYVGYLTLTSGAGSATGTFTGDVTLPNSTTGEQTFHFFYLGSGSQTLTAGTSTKATVSFASQNIYNNGGKLENASAHHVGYGSAKGTVKDGGVTGINVMMKSKVALARFSFKKSGTPASPYTGALTLSGDHIYNSMTVGFGGTFSGETTDGGKINLTNTTTPEKYVMLVPAGATAATLKFDAGAGTTDCNLANGIEANKYYGQGGTIEVMVKVPVPVTGVTLNKSTLSLKVGAYENLTATVAPAGATNKNVTWSSSAEGVATVDGTGKVTAVAVGTATITVTTEDGGMTATCTVTVTESPSYLPGEFTVSSGVKVKFSKGNLQYIGSATTPYWKFAEHQWDYIATGSGQGTDAANVDRDLFGWGCTGYQDTRSNAHTYQKNYQPYSTSNTSVSGGSSINYYGYGPDYYDGSKYGLTVENKSDWGCLAIGGDPAGTWRTLSRAEWVWLLGPKDSPNPGSNCRTSSTINGTANARYAEVKVNGVCGMMVFPDVFAWPSGVSSLPSTFNTNSSSWNDVDYSTADFGNLESAGVVFLPAAGSRVGTSVGNVGSYGFYWSSSCDSSADAYEMYFYSTSVNPQGTNDRYRGFSVRLVR